MKITKGIKLSDWIFYLIICIIFILFYIHPVIITLNDIKDVFLKFQIYFMSFSLLLIILILRNFITQLEKKCNELEERIEKLEK